MRKIGFISFIFFVYIKILLLLLLQKKVLKKNINKKKNESFIRIGFFFGSVYSLVMDNICG